MILSSISLRNFRGYAHVDLDLKPITILVGPNSAGKSSFGHAVVGLKQAGLFRTTLPNLEKPPLEMALRGTTIDFNAWPIDLGNLETLRTSGREGPVEIHLGLNTPIGAGRFEASFGGRGASGLELSGLRVIQPGVVSSVAGGVLEDAPETIPVKIVSADGSSAAGEAASISGPWLSLRRLDSLEWMDELAAKQGQPSFAGWQKMGFIHFGQGTYFRVDNEVLHRFREAIELLRYVAPNRMNPWRSKKANSGVADDVGADGAYFVEVLKAVGKQPLAIDRPAKLPKSIEDAKAALESPWIHDANPPSILEWVDYWVEELRIAKKIDATVLGDVVHVGAQVHDGDRERELPDIGFGVSQVLPVLVQALALPPEGILIVEQPESQLHPRPQAALADLFCSLAKADRQFIVESHSEAMFHRLRLRVAMDPSLESLIAVYFVDQSGPEGCCKPRRVSLRDDDVPWPKGFLSESIEEEIALRAIHAARESVPRE